MTAHTTFAQCFVLEHKWAALRGVTLETRFVLAQQGHASTFETLRQVRAAAFDRVSFVRVMAIGATDFTLQHGVVMGELECCAHFRMALEAGGRRFSRINNRAAFTAALNV
jgi:hypothetical protein